MEDIVGLVGREEFLATLKREVTKGKHMLLTGPPGIGKSAVLRALYTQMQTHGAPAIYVTQASPAKPMLIEMAQQLHERFHALPYAELALGKGVADKAPEEILWRDLAKTISRMQIRELSGLLLDVLAKASRPYTIFLDAMEAVTPTQKAVLLAMFEKAQLVGATIEKRTSKNLARLWWKFKTLEIPPLDDDARLQIIERFIDARHLLIENPHMFRKHVVKACGGNPQALADLLVDANKERLIKKTYIREEMKHEAGEHYFDLTPIAILGCCCIMASRFMARGMDSADIYLLASTTSAFLLFARMFLARGAAKN